MPNKADAPVITRIQRFRLGFFLLWDIVVAIGGAAAAGFMFIGTIHPDPANIALIAAAIGVGSLRRIGRPPEIDDDSAEKEKA